MQATDEAMEQIAESIRERDVRIVALEQLVTDLGRDHAPMPLLPARTGRQAPPGAVDTAETEAVAGAARRPGGPWTSETERPGCRSSRAGRAETAAAGAVP